MSELTFVEAMALDPGEVEVDMRDEKGWVRLRDHSDRSVAHMRMKRYRRSRPRPTRLQELVAKEINADRRTNTEFEALGIKVVQAVCEYLRERVRTSPPSGPHFADDIEREFLEPR